MIFGGLTMIAFGLFTKLGAVLSAIPDPLVGVVLATSMAMVGGVAIANVQAVNLRITRNIAILGFSLMMGMVIPEYYKRNPGTVKTGVMTLDQMIEVLMSLPMFVGSFTAFVLDNTVGGATRQQRGLRERGVVWELPADGRDIYAFPGPLQRAVEAIPLLKHMPFIPRHKKDFGNIKAGYYIAFQRDGVPLEFTVLVVVRFIIAIIGVLFNACLLYVAVNTYALRGSCNFLISFNAFCLVMFLPFMGVGVFKSSFVPIQTCFWWQFIPMFFGNLFIISTLAIAIDRLLSVLFSSWHSRQNKEFSYLSSVLTICVLYAACIVYICYTAAMKPGDVSLFVIIILISVGYFLSTMIRFIALFMKFPQFAYIVFGSSMFSVLAMAANAPVLCIFSSDYQSAFREHFPLLFHRSTEVGGGRFNRGTTAVPVSVPARIFLRV
uniref:Xanthine permease n=1 Tax=Globodera pallida TaxID=36090 RepID=A0A183BT19_GLOPA